MCIRDRLSTFLIWDPAPSLYGRVLCASTLNLIAVCHQGDFLDASAWDARLSAQLERAGVRAACVSFSLPQMMARLEYVTILCRLRHATIDTLGPSSGHVGRTHRSMGLPLSSYGMRFTRSLYGRYVGGREEPLAYEKGEKKDELAH